MNSTQLELQIRLKQTQRSYMWIPSDPGPGCRVKSLQTQNTLKHRVQNQVIKGSEKLLRQLYEVAMSRMIRLFSPFTSPNYRNHENENHEFLLGMDFMSFQLEVRECVRLEFCPSAVPSAGFSSFQQTVTNPPSSRLSVTYLKMWVTVVSHQNWWTSNNVWLPIAKSDASLCTLSQPWLLKLG